MGKHLILVGGGHAHLLTIANNVRLIPQDCRQKLRCARLDLEQAERRYFAILILTFCEFIKDGLPLFFAKGSFELM
jgi:hypothetical protein